MQTSGPVLRSALFGCGGIGALHARAYSNCKNVRLTAVVDANRTLADDLAAQHNVRAFYSVEDALADKTIDMVDVALPTRLHSPIAVQAAQAGKHCICEKPIATNAEEYQQMAEAFKRSGTGLGGIFQHRFSDAAMDLGNKIRSSELGDDLKASSTTIWWRPAAYWLVPGRGAYATAGGGVFMVHAIHAIDLITSLLGEPVSVNAHINNIGSPAGVEVEHTGIASILFRNGAMTDILATTRVWAPQYSGTADHMALVERHQLAVSGSKNSVMIETPPASQTLEVLFGRNLDDFAGSAIAGSPAIVSGDSAMRTVGLIQKMYESAGNGGSRVDI